MRYFPKIRLEWSRNVIFRIVSGYWILGKTEKALANGNCKSDIEHIWLLIYRFGFYRGVVMMSALSGIDIALWDLKGEIN